MVVLAVTLEVSMAIMGQTEVTLLMMLWEAVGPVGPVVGPVARTVREVRAAVHNCVAFSSRFQEVVI